MWQEQHNNLTKTFNFTDFKSALEFVNKVGELAETAKHHPDIELSWGRVVIKLTSHDEGRVTDKDLKLAAEIDQL